MFNKGSKFGNFVKIYKPSITSPTSSSIAASLTPIITASSFVKFGGLSHASTDWQVASDSSFSNIVWQSNSNSSNKTSITSGSLGSGTRYIRVRYRSQLGNVSEWSDAVSFTSPFASGSNIATTSATNVDVNATTTVTLQPGTYTFTLWGARGGGGSGGAPSSGAGGSVIKSVTYNTETNVTFQIGTAGAGGSGGGYQGPGAVGGTPGGGTGAASGDWRGGGGGGYSNVAGMTAAGGGAAGTQGGSAATAGGQPPSEGANSGAGYGGGGCAGYTTGQTPGSAAGGSSGSNGGGGGGGSTDTGSIAPSCNSGNGGQNSGSYSQAFAGSFSTPGNSYVSPGFSRTFGSGNGGARIQKTS